MAKPARQWTPVRAPGGTVIHAFEFYSVAKTACGRKMKRYRVHMKEIVDCRDCKLAIGPDCRPQRRRRRR